MILWEEHNEIGILTLDSHGKNALSIEDIQLFIETIETHKNNIHGLILTGNNQSFCSGLSIDENKFAEAFPLLDTLLLKLFELEFPVVCAMPGHAIGAGFLIMCCTDIVYAVVSDRAKFGVPEVKLNLGIDDLMLEVLHERLNQKQLRHLLLTGDYVSQKRLIEWGVVTEVFSTNDELMEKSFAFITESIKHQKSYGFTKRLLNREKCLILHNLLLGECWNKLVESVK